MLPCHSHRLAFKPVLVLAGGGAVAQLAKNAALHSIGGGALKGQVRRGVAH